MKIRLEIDEKDLAALKAAALAWDHLDLSEPTQRQLNRARKILDKANESMRRKSGIKQR